MKKQRFIRKYQDKKPTPISISETEQVYTDW